MVARLRPGGAEEEGDPSRTSRSVAAPGLSEDLAMARDQVRWFRLVSNHVVDLVKRYSDADLPRH